MPKTYTHLSSEERDEIAVLFAQIVSLNDIAAQLRRSVSTISRERERNGSPIYDGYHAHRAQQRAAERKSNAHRPAAAGLKNSAIRRYVTSPASGGMKQGWSPEQIHRQTQRGLSSIEY